MESKFKTKVSLQGKYKDSIWYKLDCDCAAYDHNCMIEIEYDTAFDIINLGFYKTVSFDWWKHNLEYDGPFWRVKNYWNRIKKAFILLFTGEMEMEEFLIFTKEEHINDFIEAMQEGLEYCREAKRKFELEKITKEIESDKIIGENDESEE